jgi:eukaryotic-like serine/threonine-protein kinase
MTLTSGTSLGRYEILSPIGAGGMGEVWKARDSRLSRPVAIKVLPENLARDPARLKRFEREARAICALNHPNIVTLYEVGREEEISYIAMELVEGRTLRDILADAPLPVKRTLAFGQQIAEGLAAAHVAGIVHRDLKPENVAVAREGHVKILDFGLARLGRGEPGPTEDQIRTITRDTEAGAVLGTVGYMSPEQASGKPADYRCDQFALGAILYEMTTGRRAFERDTGAQTLAAIIEDEPEPIVTASPATPAPLRWIIERCLCKDSKERYVSTRDLARDLADVERRISEIDGSARGEAGAPSVSRRLRWIGLAALGALAVFLTAIGVFHRGAPPAHPVRSTLLLPERLSVNTFSLSPDGRYIAVSARDRNGVRSLWVRQIDSPSAEALAGTETAVLPFWSPDSRSIGFFTEGKLQRIDVSGGPATTVCQTVARGVGGSWSPSGVIVFGTTSGPVYQVPASGGTARPVTKVDASRHETCHRWPAFLPDGRHFLFLADNMGAGPEDPANRLEVGSIDSGETESLMPTSTNVVYASGHLIYSHNGNLMARRFDAARRRIESDAAAVARPVRDSTDFPMALFSVSQTGAIVFQEDPGPNSRLVWIDRAGNEVGSVGDRDALAGTRLSRDGRRLAQVIFNPGSRVRDIWIYDLERGGRTKFVSDDTNSLHPVWSPDGKQLLFGADRTGTTDLFAKATDGLSAERLILGTDADERPRDWSPDGRYIVFDSRPARGDRKVVLTLLPLFGDRTPIPLVVRGRRTGDARFSPDGRWIAYNSEESGRSEVYVSEYPHPATRWPISTAGGSEARWRPDGKELFYRSPDGRMMRVEVTATPSFRATTPTTLFDTRRPAEEGGGNKYEVSSDGQRFLMVLTDEEHRPELTLLLNWPNAVKK